MISTAPISRARIAASVLGPVRPEQTTTGTGFWDMSFSRKVSPSIRGISKSKRITSGRNFFILSKAKRGSAATVTRKPCFSESTAESTCRTVAESSTTSTCIGECALWPSVIFPRRLEKSSEPTCKLWERMCSEYPPCGGGFRHGQRRNSRWEKENSRCGARQNPGSARQNR